MNNPIIQNSRPSALKDEIRVQDTIIKIHLAIHDKLEAVMTGMIEKLERAGK